MVKNSPFSNKTGSLNLNIMTIMTDQYTVEQNHPGIVILEGDPSLLYLLERFAERVGYSVSVAKDLASAEPIRLSEPVAVIFPSVEILESVQTLAAELTSYDIPIIVCSSVLNQAKTRELGADYCLLHPLVFDSFSTTLRAITASQREKHSIPGEPPGSLPINPV
jgi:DNA-binding response OmpR family regulator